MSSSFLLFPTVDIHLVKDDSVHGGTKLALHAFSDSREALANLPATISINTSVATISQYSPTNKGTNPIHYLIQAVAQGVSKMRFTSGNYRNMARVCVHTSLTKYWLGNDRATLYEGESNYILSTYAEFEDTVASNTYTSVADISAHYGYYKTVGSGPSAQTIYVPYVSYASHNANYVKVLTKPGLHQHLFAIQETADPVDVEVYVNYVNDAVIKLVAGAGTIVVADLTILSGGSGYSIAPEVRIIGGTGSGAAVIPTMTGNVITGFTLVSGGSGYTVGEELKVVVVRDKTSNAKATVTITNGVVTAFNLVRGGSGYNIAPKVRIVGGGTNANITANVNGGQVTGFTIVNGGSGYAANASVFITRQEHIVPVTVKESLDTIQQDVVFPVQKALGTGAKRNVLFISEGFNNSDDFKKVCKEMVANLRNNYFEPYNTLADSMNFWGAYLPSDRPGITLRCGINVNLAATTALKPASLVPRFPYQKFEVETTEFTLAELLEKYGCPPTYNIPSISSVQTDLRTATGKNTHTLRQDIYDYWVKNFSLNAYTQASDTILGYSTGSRVGDRETAVRTSPINPNTWEISTIETSTIGIDERRKGFITSNPDDLDYTNSTFQFLSFEKLMKSLKLNGVASNHPNYHIGNNWCETGPDNGLVCVVVNATTSGGIRSGSAFASTLGVDRVIDAQKIAGSQVKWEIVPTAAKRHPLATAAVFAHEMGHSTAFQLNDEYEEDTAEDAHHTILDSSNPEMEFSDLKDVEDAPNTTSHRKIAHPSGGKDINPAQVKWNWHRIELVSVLTQAATNTGGSPNRIRLYVPVADVANWQKAKDDDRDVFLRNSDLNTDPYTNRLRVLGELTPLNIHSVNATTGEMLLNGDLVADPPNDFPAQASHLYIPLLSSSEISSIDIDVAGSGYNQIPTVKIKSDTGNYGAIVVNGLTNGGLTTGQITITPGEGYLQEPKLVVIAAEGDNPNPIAKLRAKITPIRTDIIAIKVVDGGSGYTSVPNVNITGGASGGVNAPGAAAATALLGNDTLTGFTIDNAGSGYAREPKVVITGGNGRGADYSVFTLKPVTGEIFTFFQNNEGSNYTVTPNVQIIAPNNNLSQPVGSGANITAVTTANGSIEPDLNVVAGGSGYELAAALYLTITDSSGGTGAVAKAILNSSFEITDPILVVSGGSGYVNANTIDISITGYDDLPTFTVSVASGQITAINVNVASASGKVFIYKPDPFKVVIKDQSGSIMEADVKVVVAPNGSIQEIKVLDPGFRAWSSSTNYTVEITGGTLPDQIGGAQVSAIIRKKVVAVTLNTNANGSGYLHVPVINFSGGTTGTHAKAVAILGAYSYLIDHNVLKHQMNTKKAFKEKITCDDPETDYSLLVPDSGIPGYEYPMFRPYVVGIYEGAATWNCKAYRPTGLSLMYDQNWRQDAGSDPESKVDTGDLFYRFNYPSRYFMICQINAKFLAKLDKQMLMERGLING